MPKNSPRAIAHVQEFFPEVTTLVDAKDNFPIIVSKQDAKDATVKDMKSCAVAKACERIGHHAVVSRSTVIMVHGKKAVRYVIPSRLRNEIVVFDRGGKFQAGEYQLYAPARGQRLGEKKPSGPRNHKTGRKVKRFAVRDIRKKLGTIAVGSQN